MKLCAKLNLQFLSPMSILCSSLNCLALSLISLTQTERKCFFGFTRSYLKLIWLHFACMFSSRFHTDQYGVVPFFVFGDFNFRTDTQGVVKVMGTFVTPPPPFLPILLSFPLKLVEDITSSTIWCFKEFHSHIFGKPFATVHTPCLD